MNFNSFQRFVARILLVSLCLQSCGGGFDGNPLIPTREEKGPQIQDNIQPLVDQTLTAEGGNTVTFYEETNGEIKASVQSLDEKGKVYNGLPVEIKEGIDVASLKHLPKKIQQNHIYFQPSQGEESAKIVIYKGVGLMGGMQDNEDEEPKQKKQEEKKGHLQERIERLDNAARSNGRVSYSQYLSGSINSQNELGAQSGKSSSVFSVDHKEKKEIGVEEADGNSEPEAEQKEKEAKELLTNCQIPILVVDKKANHFVPLSRAIEKESSSQSRLSKGKEKVENKDNEEKDEREAFEWLQKAAEQGNSDAQYRLGSIYYYGSIGLACDFRQACEWYTKAALQGNNWAYNKLIEYCKNLEHNKNSSLLILDNTLGLKWFEEAARQGNVRAKFILGLLYEHRKDNQKAEECYKVVVSKDIDINVTIGAQFNLGRLYKNNQDKENAREWFQKAAEQNYPAAQYNLSIINQEEGDYAEAIKWIYKAALLNYQPASQLLKEFNNKYPETVKNFEEQLIKEHPQYELSIKKIRIVYSEDQINKSYRELGSDYKQLEPANDAIRNFEKDWRQEINERKVEKDTPPINISSDEAIVRSIQQEELEDEEKQDITRHTVISVRTKENINKLNFNYFENFEFNILDDVLRNQKINKNLRENNLKRKAATTIGNNCLLDSIFQLIIYSVEQQRPSLLAQIGESSEFFNWVRNKIGDQSGFLSINDEIDGLCILTAVQAYFKEKLKVKLAFNLTLLLTDNDGEIGLVDNLSELQSNVDDGDFKVDLRIMHVNYNHYEPLFEIDSQSSLTKEDEARKCNLDSNLFSDDSDIRFHDTNFYADNEESKGNKLESGIASLAVSDDLSLDSQSSQKSMPSSISGVSNSTLRNYEEGYDSEEEETWQYLSDECEKTEEGKAAPVLIPFFRGVHLFKDRFSSPERMRFLQLRQTGIPIFSSASFKMLKIGYGDQDSHTQDLILEAKKVKRKVAKLKEKTEVVVKDKTFDAYTGFHYLYVNSYTAFIANLGQFSSIIFKNFRFLENPLVSVAELPNHPLLYAFGLKIDKIKALRPCFDLSGKPLHPYLGKIYTMLVPLSKTREDKVFRMVEAATKKEMPVDYRIKYEIEAAFPGWIRGEYVVYERIVRVPNFKHSWTQQHLLKYGLTKTVYNNLRKNILATKGDYGKQETIYEDLVHKIVNKNTNYCWSSQLRQIAIQEAQKRQARSRFLDLNRLATTKPLAVNKTEEEDANQNFIEHLKILGDIDLNVDSLNKYNTKGATALGRVCENDKLSEEEACRFAEFLIIKKGASVNIPHQKTGKTPLHIAAAFNKTKLISLLCKSGADLNSRARDGATPLILASYFHGNVPAIILLAKLGADLNAVTYPHPNLTNGGGMTALHHAAQEGLVANIKALLKLGANPRLRTIKGKNVAYHLEGAYQCKQISEEHYQEIIMLLERVKDSSTVKDLEIDLKALSLVESDNPLADFIVDNKISEVDNFIKEGKLSKSQLQLGFEVAVQQCNYAIASRFKGKLPKEEMIKIVNKKIDNLKELLRFNYRRLHEYESQREFALSRRGWADQTQEYMRKTSFYASRMDLVVAEEIRMTNEVIGNLGKDILAFKDLIKVL
ncbi:hypothetical protein Aasi_1290 [Candidatus Amoebophilus asiaticus 5a2]|uniref:Uncharacterized protein n=1 Tax=Amoebophilus asiaticus (strain 5a2) TaxID=452471 RepID=B3ETQ2_AMOA5|nr:ankyrin repeat domain-containing protein [Candidatus Amoebophilus asiaticus]ACE06604.1 hypothetical protein Aasi_1290 [Candidatus Amoebophilus asiaticus 5a2]